MNEATEGDYYFTGTVLATINSKTIERTITGDDLVTIKGTNWRDEWFGDTSEEGLTITTSELQDAIHHWLDDELDPDDDDISVGSISSSISSIVT